ncbi:UNVERIFIED_CONTAM: hypothetical protein Sindi_3068900, partial [Sesamum indicum]
RFPRGPSRLGLHENATLNSVIHENQWQWPLITDMESLRDYSHTASYRWRIRSDYLEIYEWETHHSGALSAYDATGTGKFLVICSSCGLRFWRSWPQRINHGYPTLGIAYFAMMTWSNHTTTCSSTEDLVDDASALYDAWYGFSGVIGNGHKILYGGHENGVGNISSTLHTGALLGSCVYLIWKERNTRRFEQVENPPSMVANLIMEDMRQRIISLELPSSVSTRALYRLWRIPWPVEGDT